MKERESPLTVEATQLKGAGDGTDKVRYFYDWNDSSGSASARLNLQAFEEQGCEEAEYFPRRLHV